MEKRIKYNSFAFVFLIFVYSITTVFSVVMSQSTLIILFSVLLIGPIIVFNLRHLSVRYVWALFFIVIVLLVLLFQSTIYLSNNVEIMDIILQFATIGSLSIIVGLFDLDNWYVHKAFTVLSIICFFTSLFYLILIKGSFFMSMRFGYAMLPSSAWFLCLFINKRRFVWLILFLSSLLLLITYGSRGTLLCIGLLIILFAIKNKWWWLVLFSVAFVLFSDFFIEAIIKGLQWLADISGAQKISRLIALFGDNVEDSTSGRNYLYKRCIQLFMEKPMGSGVGFWYSDPIMSGLFPHNIFLEIAVEFGIFGLLVFIGVFVVMLIKLFKLNSELFPIFAALFAICFGRLLVSSMYWARPEFWLLVSIFLFNRPSNAISKRL